ncbi:MAG: hypothetical protein ACI8TX_002929 [Hyphomicrobiaceae bacterium]|jgi:hypothetical protein
MSNNIGVARANRPASTVDSETRTRPRHSS